jgi:hypothetical protein
MRKSSYKQAIEQQKEKKNPSFEQQFAKHMFIHELVQKQNTQTNFRSIHAIESDVDTTKLFIPQLD